MIENEETVRTDFLYFETREQIIKAQNNISKMINYNLECFRKIEKDIDTNIFLNNALKLSIIYKNLGGNI